MNESSTRVSIVIINYNTPDLVRILLNSITAHTNGITCDVTVVDNGSDSNLRFVQPDNTPIFTLINSPSNLGFARGANLGARGKTAPYLLFANSDCRLTSNVILPMAEYLSGNHDCAACSPRLENEEGTILSSIRNFPTFNNIRHSRGSILGSRGDYTLVADSSRKKVEALSGTFMMVKRELFEQVGGFDEDYFMYVEDTDLCRKFYDSGKYVVHLGDLMVIHHWGASSSRRPLRMKLEHHRSIRHYFRKYYPDSRLKNIFLTLQLAVNFLLVSLRFFFTGR